MSDVHRARIEATGEEVALKVMRAPATFDDEAATRERFAREARVLAGLSHPSIVRYVAHGTTLDGRPYVAAEWLDGETLADRIARSRLAPRDAAALGASLADALATAHAAGVVHRDVKPTNVMIGRDGQPKLIDFGVAKSNAPALTLDGAIVGSHGYMSPEQLRGSADVGAGADVYALGCVLFRTLTGATPFEGPSEAERLARMLLENAPDVRERRPDVPESLALVIATMLQAEPKERPTARDLTARLAAIARDIDSVAPASIRDDALSRAEQSLVSVVVVSATAPDAATTPGQAAPVDPVFDDVRAALSERGARVEKLPSGACAAIFGPRAALGEQVHAAACAALEARRIAGDRPIALTTGRAEIAARGTVGDALARAAALARLGGTAVSVDEATASLLASRFVVESRGTVYALVSERSAPEAARTVRGRVVPLFGRDDERTALERAWRACVDTKRGAAVLIVGAAGVGKTRLSAELAHRVRAIDAHVVVARADPLASGAPYALARAIATSLVDVDAAPASRRSVPPGSLASAQQRRRSRPDGGENAMPGATLTPFVAQLLGRGEGFADDEALRAARLDPALMRDRLRDAFAAVVARAHATRPLLVIVEDLQWADAASIRLLAHAAASAPRALLVLALARPEIDDGPLPFGPDAKVIRLAPLGTAAARSLARTVAGDEAGEDTIDRIVRLGDGNAFFVEELARVASSSGSETLPESVVAITHARLGALPAYARHVLRAASLLRPWIAREPLVELLGTSAAGADLDATLDELVGREVLVREEGGFVFRHELLAEAAHASLTEEDARRGHLATASLLVRRGASDPRRIAEHLERGGDRAGAARAFARAAKAALDGDAASEALACADRAVACGAEGEALGLANAVRAAALRWRGDLRRAIGFGIDALAVLEPGSAAYLEAAADVGACAGSAGDIPALERVAGLLLDLADDSQAWRIRAFAAVAVSLIRIGDVVRADLLLGRADAMRARLGSDHAIADIGLLNARAARRNYGGDPLAYLETMPAVVENAMHLRDLRTACLARAHLGYGWAAVGAWNEAGETLRVALDEAEKLALPAARASALHNLSLVAEAEGDRDRALALQEEALAASIDQRATRLATACRLYLAHIRLRAGRPDLALVQASAAREAAKEAPLVASAEAALALVHAARGEGDLALSHARAAMEIYVRIGGAGEDDGIVHLALARSLVVSGDADAARAAAVAARDRLSVRASLVSDPRLRASFLTRVPDSVETSALCRELGLDGANLAT
jgi:hypothetical protein